MPVEYQRAFMNVRPALKDIEYRHADEP